MGTATARKSGVGFKTAAVGAIALAGVIGITKAVVNVDDPGKVVRWEVRSTNIMKVLVEKRTSLDNTEYLVGSSRGPQLIGNRGGERPRPGYARTGGETTVAAGEVATIVVIAVIDDTKTDPARSDIACTIVTNDHPPVSHHGATDVECSLTVAG